MDVTLISTPHPPFPSTSRLQREVDEALSYLVEAVEVPMNGTLALTLLPALRSAAAFTNASDGKWVCACVCVCVYYIKYILIFYCSDFCIMFSATMVYIFNPFTLASSLKFIIVLRQLCCCCVCYFWHKFLYFYRCLSILQSFHLWITTCLYSINLSQNVFKAQDEQLPFIWLLSQSRSETIIIIYYFQS